MPCDLAYALRPPRQIAAVERLKKAISAGAVQVTVSATTGAFSLKGWSEEEREGVCDVCAYRLLKNSPELRRALVRAEVFAGRSVNQQTLAAQS